MPKSISATLPHVPTPVGPSAREHTRKQVWASQPIEARVSALEARWEETVPTLATSVDLSDVRGELRAVENRLIIWVLGAAGGLLFAVLGIFASGYVSLNARIDSVSAKIDSAVSDLRVDLRAEIRENRDETRAAIADLRAEIRESRDETRAAIADLRAEIRETNARLDSRFDALMSELRSQHSEPR